MPLSTWRPSERGPQFTEGEMSMCAVSHDQEKDDPRKASKTGAGEPQGGKRNTCLSPGLVVIGPDLRDPDILKDFW